METIKETKAQRAERLKRALNPWEAWDDFTALAREGHTAIPEPWLKTYLRWWGIYTQGDGTGVVGWHLVRATLLKGMTGTYTLDAVGDGTRVTYDLEVDLTMPMIGMLKRKAERHIINTALTELKKRAEG